MTPVRKFIGAKIEQARLKRDIVSDELIQFYERNPDEFLTIRDICDKYDAAQSLVSGVVADLLVRGFVSVKYEARGVKLICAPNRERVAA